MANITNTSIDVGSVALGYEQEHDDTVTSFTGTYVKGCIMARDSGTLKLVPFVKGGVTTGNGIPKAVLCYDVVGAGADVPVRVIVKGEVNQARLIINADGTGANVDAAVTDALRAYDITPVNVQQLSS